MTNITSEEAIEQLKILKAFTGYEKDNPIIIKLHEALDMAMKALEYQPYDEDFIQHKNAVLERIAKRECEIAKYIKELEKYKQQPCENYVSRADVKEQMLRYGFKAPDMTVTEFVEDCLSPVTPQRPRGKWIDDCGGVKCSCCGYSIDDDHYAKAYCTNCGAEMEG